MSEIVLLDMEDLRLAHGLLRERFKDDPEPMPAWFEGDRAALETCCHSTEVGAFGAAKYPRLVDKTAKLFYSAIKLHAFPNGNKRFAVMITLLFVLLNGHRIVAGPGELVDAATQVADADPRGLGTGPDQVVEELTAFFGERMVPSEPWSTP